MAERRLWTCASIAEMAESIEFMSKVLVEDILIDESSEVAGGERKLSIDQTSILQSISILVLITKKTS